MAPKRPQVVSFKALTVRSGSALPSLHQNSQPISQGTYSASSFMRSNTMRAASMTSWPTPSPGIHAILYLAIGGRFYRHVTNPQAPLVFATADYADDTDKRNRRKQRKPRCRIVLEETLFSSLPFVQPGPGTNLTCPMRYSEDGSRPDFRRR